MSGGIGLRFERIRVTADDKAHQELSKRISWTGPCCDEIVIDGRTWPEAFAVPQECSLSAYTCEREQPQKHPPPPPLPPRRAHGRRVNPRAGIGVVSIQNVHSITISALPIPCATDGNHTRGRRTKFRGSGILATSWENIFGRHVQRHLGQAREGVGEARFQEDRAQIPGLVCDLPQPFGRSRIKPLHAQRGDVVLLDNSSPSTGLNRQALGIVHLNGRHVRSDRPRWAAPVATSACAPREERPDGCRR